MDGITLRPDPPGTINPAKLSMAASADDMDAPASFALNPDEIQVPADRATHPPLSPLDAAIPRLARISSDWDPEDDIVPRENLKYEEMRCEFEQSFFPGGLPPPSRRARHVSHHGYFRSQTSVQSDPRVPLDPEAGPGSIVVVDKASATIFDAYLLRADIKKNLNAFHRHQITFDPCSSSYALWTREGRVGLPGQGHRRATGTDLRRLTVRFRSIFREKTGVTWSRRYGRPPLQPGLRYCPVELDYRPAPASRSVEARHYGTADADIHEDVRELMDVMLCGAPPVGTGAEGEKSGSGDARSAYTAPYEHLSPWTCFLGFKTLQHIYAYLETARPIRWKVILSASSWYRSQIPFGTGHGRTPVVSSYPAIFLELKFLYSLWPRPDVLDALTTIYLRGTLQLSVYKALVRPMYHAYSSLRHGFRRLTDPSTVEFRELEAYLAGSCHKTHRLQIELRDIYRVFVKSNLPNPYLDWIEAASQGSGASDEERLLLWHGTPLDSLLGILDLGLQIRRRGFTWTGTMFGNGIYLADASSKSATFCKHSSWGGEAVLLLCEADVGRQRIRSVRSMGNGPDVVGATGGRVRCIQGCGMTGPVKWKDIGWEMSGAPSTGVVRMPDTSVPYAATNSGGILGFNEYVIYNTSHVLIRYVFRIKIKG
ncbi:poly polymerase catalytic domain-containing protein [Lasiosphaeris hirsuta]|uniref:Poly [ADP-ribose] polymerase n=1 Tax=Lasiosphaeris hirsuta TaxID=260670 RepID=A0AA40DTY1_9PEZI|nr:poly polymerase catalytic domain-containing protein [Lasiosphaeris hirsuta]